MISTLVIISVSVDRISPRILRTFSKSGEYHYDEQSSRGPFAYHLFVPRSLKPAERCPLLVWLHWGDNVSTIDQLEVVI